MRCLNCLSVCGPADSTCPSCNRPLNLGRRRRSLGGGVSRYAVVTMVLGEAAFNTFGRRWFPSNGHEINTQFLMWAAVVGAACALLGGLIGMMLGGPNDLK